MTLFSSTAAPPCSPLLRLPNYTNKKSLSFSFSSPPNFLSFRFSTSNLSRRNPSLSLRSTSSLASPPLEGVAPAISVTENALKHLNRIKNERNEDLCLRIGVKQGGCSGMSYTMDFENRANARPDDSIIECNGFVIVCDPKSLLFIFGMQLDYSDALIGGGFSFKNPNATKTCGCGKSFAA
uniref:Core domain-containing protein n=1 Tax=Salix viminalis TaxID=40686 RepID=A0A6N2LYW1_SALVM